ncbi:MAG: hypothetical protein F6K65_03885 [Moorea sp. SIO3C2]|nr:hypothetical protein [Moorena sp. SIO3C2]
MWEVWEVWEAWGGTVVVSTGLTRCVTKFRTQPLPIRDCIATITSAIVGGAIFIHGSEITRIWWGFFAYAFLAPQQ